MILSLLNNLIFKINRWHLLQNGAGELPSTKTKENLTNWLSETLSAILSFITSKLMKVAQLLYNVLCKFVYFIVKIVLNVMDFVMVIISELSGQAQGFDMEEVNSNLENSDILFRFLLNSYTLTILKRLFIYALFLLILITIFSIVMNEWKNATKSETNTYKNTLIRSLGSIFMMFFLPFIVIVGIISSNVILASLVASVNPSGTTRFSVGATLFASATYDANLYRNYADAGQKIPIVFDFDGGFENARDSIERNPELQDNDYLSSGYSTYSMFQTEEYFTFAQIPDDSSYYNYYDGQYLKTKRIEYYVMADFIDYAMQSGEEFYIKNAEDIFLEALAVLKDYEGKEAVEGVKYSDFLYPDPNTVSFTDAGDVTHIGIDFNQINEKYLSGFEMYNFQTLREIFSTIVPYKINSDGTEEAIPLYDADNKINSELSRVAYYKINVKYNTDKLQNTDEVASVEYIAYPGATNEVDGAVYLYTTKKTLVLKDLNEAKEGRDEYINITLNCPVLKNSGSKVVQSGSAKKEALSTSTLYQFKTNYLSTEKISASNDVADDVAAASEPATEPESINCYQLQFIQKGKSKIEYVSLPSSLFIARGAFTSDGHPTAIKESGGDIVFYRHDISSPKSMSLKPLTTYSSTSSNGTTTDLGDGGDFFSRVLGFGNSSINSKLTASISASQQFYKIDKTVGTFKNGFYTLNYSFVNTEIGIENIYDLGELNIILLVVASVTLLKVLVYIIFGLIKRLLELTVLWFTYPAWLLKYPLESGKGSILQDSTFQKWSYRFMERTLSVYALYIGLALYYAFVPVVMASDIVPTSVVINTSDGNIFNNVSPELVSWLINTMFILVLFTFVDKVESIVGNYILKGNSKTGSALSSEGKEVFDASIGNVKQGIELFNVKKQVKKAGNKVKEYAMTAVDMVPGSALAKDAAGALKQHRDNKKYDKLVQGYGDTLRNATTNDELRDALNNNPVEKTESDGDEKVNQYQKKYRQRTKKIMERRKRVEPKNKSK